MKIEFIYNKRYCLTLDDGRVKAIPPLPTTPKLYLLWNHKTKSAYIGTANDLNKSFEAKLKTLRELGVNQDFLDYIYIIEIKMRVDGRIKAPNENGEIDGVNVENLLVRTYVEHFKTTVGNIEKLDEEFFNNADEKLNFSLVNGEYPWLEKKYRFRLKMGEKL